MNRELVLEQLNTMQYRQSPPVDLGASDFIVEGSNLVVDSPGVRPIMLSAGAFDALGKMAGISKKLTGDLSDRPDLRAEIIRHQANDFSKANRFRRFLTPAGEENPMAAFIIPERYPLFNPVQMFEAVERSVAGDPNDFLFDVQALTPDQIVFSIAGPEQTTVARGDLFKAGISTQISISGQKANMMNLFTVRLVCTNGMMSTTVLEKVDLRKNRSDELDVVEWAEQYAGILLDRVDEEYRAIEQTAEITISDPAAMLDGMFDSFHIRGATQQAIMSELLSQVREEQITVYDVVNAMTAVATHDLGMRENLETVNLQRLASQLTSVQLDPCWRFRTPSPDIVDFLN